tara:strand:- start:1062 stop:1250 length:189 start_codon:yes stop_codon:yes gene_type:complete
MEVCTFSVIGLTKVTYSCPKKSKSGTESNIAKVEKVKKSKKQDGKTEKSEKRTKKNKATSKK